MCAKKLTGGQLKARTQDLYGTVRNRSRP